MKSWFYYTKWLLIVLRQPVMDDYGWFNELFYGDSVENIFLRMISVNQTATTQPNSLSGDELSWPLEQFRVELFNHVEKFSDLELWISTELKLSWFWVCKWVSTQFNQVLTLVEPSWIRKKMYFWVWISNQIGKFSSLGFQPSSSPAHYPAAYDSQIFFGHQVHQNKKRTKCFVSIMNRILSMNSKLVLVSL